MSDFEEDEPRFQGSDDDVFVSAKGIVYDQTAGEEMAKRIEDLIAVIKVLRQTVMEVSVAQNSGPGWYTKGAKGLYMQVSLHINRAFEALKTIQPTLDELDKL